MSRKKYFAALPQEEIGPELIKRVSNWYDHVRISGIFDRMRRSYMTYYGFGANGIGTSSEITRAGTQGELSLIKVNHYRNLVEHVLVMTTNNRPAMEARAVNTDYRSLAQTVLANGILDYYMRDKRLERYLKSATENALIFGEGFVRIEWDATSGDEYIADPETGEMTYTGDLKYGTLTPLDVVKDLYQQDATEQDWMIIRHFKNKYDLAAKYPDLEDDIVNTSMDTADTLAFDFSASMLGDSDLIPVYEFYHKKTDALKDGRLVVFLDSDVVLFDGPLPYKDIPVYRIAPGDFIGTSHGYSPAFDLLALQEALDALYSTVVTNQSTFGVQNIMVMKGSNIAYNQLAGGLNLIEYDNPQAKPEALNLTNTPPEIFNFIQQIEKTMETLSGINSVARGNPEASLRSGSALALIQSMAIQFNSGLQQSYAQLLEDIGTATIKTLQEFATVPRIAMIVGKNNRANLQEFKGSDLDKVNRVIVDVGNPLSKTTAGKIEIAQDLLQSGLLTDAQQYLTLIETGSFDSMVEGQMAELLLIKSENENMSEGKGVIAIATDSHSLHIKEHKAVLASPEIRQNAQVVKAVLDHIAEHADLLRNTDPNLLMMIGEQPIQDQQQGGPGAPPPAGGPGGGQPPQGPTPNGASAVMQNTNPVGNTPPGMPSMPKNPLSGNKFDPQSGGM